MCACKRCPAAGDKKWVWSQSELENGDTTTANVELNAGVLGGPERCGGQLLRGGSSVMFCSSQFRTMCWGSGGSDTSLLCMALESRGLLAAFVLVGVSGCMCGCVHV